jgi:DUF1680 family protein
MRSIPISAVKLRDRFWQPRLIALAGSHHPNPIRTDGANGANWTTSEGSAGKVGGEFRGLYFNDSDVYKWLEAASWSLAVQFNEWVAQLMERVIDDIASAQDADGYLNTFFSLERKNQRWTNLRDMHELYCAGHLFQAAIAHHRVTG